mgnify:CR=1 FL=1
MTKIEKKEYTYCVCDDLGQTLFEYDNEMDAMIQCNYQNDEFVSRVEKDV